MPSSLYVHIPFCKSRCIYCDFFSTTSLNMRQRYVDALCKEMTMRHDYLADTSRQTPPPCLSSIYFGGGTPSQLTVDMLKQLTQHIFDAFDVDADAEITIEMNPDDVTPEYVQQLRQLPFNRVSLGVQTFDDERLAFIHRRHTASQAEGAVRLLQSAGYDNISIDLMFGFPGQTLDGWKADVDRAISLGVQHLSAYSLMYEEGTRLYSMLEHGDVSEIDEELSLQMYQLLIDRLADAGFRHYEISNFCMPGSHSRHNSGYWSGVHYLGIGAAAHSFDGESRQWNVSSLNEYVEGIESGVPSVSIEHLDAVQRYNEYVMTRLRTCDGVDINRLRSDFGQTSVDYCLRMAATYIADGKLIYDTECEKLSLTRDGLFVSNQIMADLMQA